MVFISDGNSEIGAHVWSKFGNLSWLRHLFKSGILKSSVYLLTCATCSELPSNKKKHGSCTLYSLKLFITVLLIRIQFIFLDPGSFFYFGSGSLLFKVMLGAQIQGRKGSCTIFIEYGSFFFGFGSSLFLSPDFYQQ